MKRRWGSKSHGEEARMTRDTFSQTIPESGQSLGAGAAQPRRAAWHVSRSYQSVAFTHQLTWQAVASPIKTCPALCRCSPTPAEKLGLGSVGPVGLPVPDAGGGVGYRGWWWGGLQRVGGRGYRGWGWWGLQIAMSLLPWQPESPRDGEEGALLN